MALDFECGAFIWPNTTAAQTISLVNSGLTPQAVIMWTKGPGSLGFTADAKFSMGFGTRRGGATQSGCVGIINRDNVSTSDNARVRNTTLLHVPSSVSATDYTITLDSFGAGTIGVTASSGTNANGDIIYYLAFGGSDITDAIVLNWTMDAISGTEVITGAGFQPSALFALDANHNANNSFAAGMIYSFGFASSATKFASFGINADDADTMTSGMSWAKTLNSDCCLVRLSGGGSIDSKWDLDSFDSDGATLGVVDAPSNTDRIATFLFLKGGQWEAGLAAKDTDTGSDDFALTNGSLTPKGVVMFGCNNNAEGPAAGAHDFCVGAMDGSHEGAAGITGSEAINTATDSFLNTDKCIEELTGNTPTETSEADFSAFSAGNFQINWSSNGGAANLLGFMAFGNNAVTTTTLTADKGSLSLAGKAAVEQIQLASAKGSLSLAGKAATLSQLLALTAGKGLLTISGGSASFAETLSASKGALALTGNDAALRVVLVFTAEKGLIALTGKDAVFVNAIAASKGTIILSGDDATFVTNLLAAKGSLLLSGNAATFGAVGSGPAQIIFWRDSRRR